LLTLPHEIFTGAWTILEQIVPPFTMGDDDAAAADLQNVDLMHILRKGDGLGQPDGLTAIAGEHRGACHGVISLYIQLGYTLAELRYFCTRCGALRAFTMRPALEGLPNDATLDEMSDKVFNRA
jgi:hypothetical protein